MYILRCHLARTFHNPFIEGLFLKDESIIKGDGKESHSVFAQEGVGIDGNEESTVIDFLKIVGVHPSNVSA
jgi:hypothetical protein